MGRLRKGATRAVRAQARIRLANLFIRGASLSLRSFGRTYHPLPGSTPTRPPDERWAMIRPELARLKPGSVLDIGCAEGWFVRKAAEEFGCWAFGVDTKDERILSGELLRLQRELDRVAILRAELTPDLIRTMPRVDVAICLSVVYHVINRQGLEAAVDFLAAIREITGKAMIFELGAANLPQFRAHGGIGEPLSGDEQDPHIRALLAEAGFAAIEELGRTWVHDREDRVIYVAHSVREGTPGGRIPE